ncbi:MAG: CDP-diacylglycerol--serine O-phosphatidyltransferase [Deltaproteobacteria bacterium]|jgi:CDP-diacylglycerol--serine O-phosphatidyltransferase|nr:CDP-diacylglycerol--serine O-phosphatidyltransferase [Deltaproteobacteria bacterium]
MRREKKERRKKIDSMRKGIYILPNLFTATSLFCGFFSLLRTLQEDFYAAAIFILISGLLDGMDGRVARYTNTTSRFGVEFDSLADVIAFGVAPGMLVFAWALEPFGRLGWLAAFLYVVCGALRLGRYNIQVNTVESRYFSGLPIPAAAGLIATGILVFYKLGDIGVSKHLTVLIATYILAFLMVSTVKYYGFKDIELFRRKPFRWLVIAILLIIVVAYEPEYTLFGLFLIYAVSGPIMTIIFLRRRRASRPLLPEEKAV